MEDDNVAGTIMIGTLDSLVAGCCLTTGAGLATEVKYYYHGNQTTGITPGFTCCS